MHQDNQLIVLSVIAAAAHQRANIVWIIASQIWDEPMDMHAVMRGRHSCLVRSRAELHTDLALDRQGHRGQLFGNGGLA